MNLLIDKAPSDIEVNNVVYPLETDFRVWIKFEIMLTSNTAPKLSDILKLIFSNKQPPETQEAVEKVLWFYRCGKPTNKATKSSSKQIYDYNYDDGYIYAAYLQQYKVSLSDVKYMHWWNFRSLFESLSEDTEFVKILGYRSMEINSKMSSEQKQFYSKMKKLYALPLSEELEAKYKNIEDALIRGESIDTLL